MEDILVNALLAAFETARDLGLDVLGFASDAFEGSSTSSEGSATRLEGSSTVLENIYKIVDAIG